MNKSEKIRFFKFALVGISGTIVDFSIFNIFLRLGFSSVASSVISFSIAVINNFIWNRLWTYPESRKASVIDQLGKFSAVSLAGLVIRTFILFVIENPMIQIAASLFNYPFSQYSELIGKNVSLAIVIIIVLFWNYFGNKMWTYKGTEK